MTQGSVLRRPGVFSPQRGVFSYHIAENQWYIEKLK
jgi:hypothetical protein